MQSKHYEKFRPCKRCKPNGLTLPNEEWVEQIKDILKSTLTNY